MPDDTNHDGQNPGTNARVSAPVISKTSTALNYLFVLAVILPCACLFGAVFQNTMSWRISWDLPLMLYTGFLMEHFSYVPYRDFFDMNMPGSHLAYLFIGKVFGYSDIGIRWADLSVVLAIMGSTLVLTRNMGFRVMLLAPFIFVFWYFTEGPSSTLQREILALPLIALGTSAAISFPKISKESRAIAAGFLFGLAATIKPHLAIGLPIAVIYLASEEISERLDRRRYLRRVLSVAAFAAGGLFIPITFVASYLYYSGSLGSFIGVLLHYLPLYSTLNFDLEVLQPGERPLYNLRSALKRVYPFLTAGALPLMYGLCNPGYSSKVQKQVALLAGMGLVYWIYPNISGQFWKYHYYPFTYFMCTAMALVVGPWSPKAFLIQRLMPLAVIFLVLLHVFRPHENFDVLFKPGDASPSGGRPDAIAKYLQENLKPGDKVQPLDVVYVGAVQGMLMARAEIATPFIYWFHFFHHVTNPYIVQLRGKFMTALNDAPPRFVIQNKVRPAYKIKEQFPELATFLKNHYEEAVKTKEYIIWERIDTPGRTLRK